MYTDIFAWTASPVYAATRRPSRDERHRHPGSGRTRFGWIVHAMIVGAVLFAPQAAIALASGSQVSGTLQDSEDTATHSFSASAGDSVVLGISGRGANRFFVYGPSGEYLGGDSAIFTNAELEATGTYTVVVSRSPGYATPGEYTLHLVVAPGTTGNGDIGSGEQRSGTLNSPGDLDSYAFSAGFGDSVIIGISGNGSNRFAVYSPTGVYQGGGGSRPFTLSASETGNYTIVVFRGSGYATPGDYNLHFVKAPGNTEFGAISSGESRSGTLDSPGDLDSYAFSASPGDSVVIGISGNGSNSFYVYGPSGAYLGGGGASAPTFFLTNAADAGTYSIVVFRSPGYATPDDYKLHFVKAPGATERGEISSGQSKSGTFASPGDLESYEFAATAGDSLLIGVSGGSSNSFYVYAPSGAYMGGGGASTPILVLNAVNETGKYTIVAARSRGFATPGEYTLHFVKAPGDTERGEIGSGQQGSGTLNSSGDLASFHFDAEAGDSFMVGISGGNANRFRVYTPGGVYLGGSNRILTIQDAPESGSYTLVAFRGSGYSTPAGYTLQFVKTPGSAEYGVMPPGAAKQATLDSPGDIESYDFDLIVGDSFRIELSGGIANFMYVFAPDGTYLGGSSGAFSLPAVSQSGRFKVVVFRGSGYSTPARYRLLYSAQRQWDDLNRLEEIAREKEGTYDALYARFWLCLNDNACKEYERTGEAGPVGGFNKFVFDYMLRHPAKAAIGFECNPFRADKVSLEVNQLACAAGTATLHFIEELAPAFGAYCSQITPEEYDDWDDSHNAFVVNYNLPCFAEIFPDGFLRNYLENAVLLGAIQLREHVQNNVCPELSPPVQAQTTTNQPRTRRTAISNLTAPTRNELEIPNPVAPGDLRVSASGDQFFISEGTAVQLRTFRVNADGSETEVTNDADTIFYVMLDDTIANVSDSGLLRITGNSSPFTVQRTPILVYASNDDSEGYGQFAIFPRDGDDDGLSDAYEASIGLSPAIANDNGADTDQDGLSDLVEVSLRTSPVLRDTDGDGYTDTEEVAIQGAPLDGTVIPFAEPRDGDGDGVSDALDNCIATPNSDQADSNDDGYGDVCQPVEEPETKVERSAPVWLKMLLQDRVPSES